MLRSKAIGEQKKHCLPSRSNNLKLSLVFFSIYLLILSCNLGFAIASTKNYVDSLKAI